MLTLNMKYVFIYRLPVTASSVPVFGEKKIFIFPLSRSLLLLQLMTVRRHKSKLSYIHTKQLFFYLDCVLIAYCLHHATAQSAILNQTNCPNSNWLIPSFLPPEWFIFLITLLFLLYWEYKLVRSVFSVQKCIYFKTKWMNRSIKVLFIAVYYFFPSLR